MDVSWMHTWTRRRVGLVGGTGLASLLGFLDPLGAEAKKNHRKRKKRKKRKRKKRKKNQPPPPDATGTLVRSQGAVGANCIPEAEGVIELFELGGVERLEVSVSGLPANTEFDVFIIENPDNPFGFSWYQGDLTTDGNGNGSQTFLGRFNNETFILEPPTTAHQTFHVGLWFNATADAVAVGCPNVTTPFNGEQNAGPQALKTVPVDGQGPLAQLG